MKFLLGVISAVVCGVVWMALIAPLIANAIGVPCRFAVWRIDRKNQHLRRWQYFWFVGVFAWGIGMFLFTTVLDLLAWRILRDPTSHRSLGFILGSFGIWLVAGMVLGYGTAPKEGRRRSPDF